MRARQNPPPPSPAEKAALIRRAHDEAKAARAQSPHLSHAALFGEAMRRLYRAYAEGWLTEHCGATPADLAQLRAVSDGSYGPIPMVEAPRPLPPEAPKWVPMTPELLQAIAAEVLPYDLSTFRVLSYTGTIASLMPAEPSIGVVNLDTNGEITRVSEDQWEMDVKDPQSTATVTDVGKELLEYGSLPNIAPNITASVLERIAEERPAVRKALAAFVTTADPKSKSNYNQKAKALRTLEDTLAPSELRRMFLNLDVMLYAVKVGLLKVLAYKSALPEEPTVAKGLGSARVSLPLLKKVVNSLLLVTKARGFRFFANSGALHVMLAAHEEYASIALPLFGGASGPIDCLVKDGYKLLKVLKSLTGAYVDVTMGNGDIKFKTQDANVELLCVGVGADNFYDYDLSTKFVEGEPVQVLGSDLLEAVDSVKYALEDFYVRSGRDLLKSVSLQSSEGKLGKADVFASDGHRLSIRRIPAKGDISPIVVPPLLTYVMSDLKLSDLKLTTGTVSVHQGMQPALAMTGLGVTLIAVANHRPPEYREFIESASDPLFSASYVDWSLLSRIKPIEEKKADHFDLRPVPEGLLVTGSNGSFVLPARKVSTLDRSKRTVPLLALVSSTYFKDALVNKPDHFKVTPDYSMRFTSSGNEDVDMVMGMRIDKKIIESELAREDAGEQSRAPTPRKGAHIGVVSRAALEEALDVISKVVKSRMRRIMPVLERSQVLVTPESLLIASTDLNVTVYSRVKWEPRGNPTEKVIMTLDTASALAAVKDLKGETVTISALPEARAEGTDLMGSLVFESDGSIGQAYAYDTKHYPALNPDVMYLGFKPASDLLDSIRMVSHAMSEDEARPQLNGVFLSNRTGVNQAAATDGHRASVAGFDKNLDISKSVLLSSGAVERLLAFKGVTGVGYAGDVRGDIASPTFEVTTKKGVRYIVHSRPLDMDYPDYTRVFPTTHIDWYLEIRDTNRLKQQLKAAIKALKANESRHFVGRINITQNKATIHTEVGDFDLGKVVGTTDKPSLQTGLNIIYLLDILDTAPVVEIQVRECLDPLVFYYKKENSYEVIMPVRV